MSGGDPTRDPPSTKFGGEAKAGQTSSSSGGSTGGEGTMTPQYGQGMGGFLGEGASGSGGDRQAKIEDDPSGGPSMRIDGGRNPYEGQQGDDFARSRDGGDDSVRTAEESRGSDDRRP